MGLTRGAPAALIAALAGHFHPVVLMVADWPDQVVRLHSGVGDLTWGGNVYSGTSITRDGKLISLLRPDLPAEEGGLATGDASVRVAGPLDAIRAEKGVALRNRSFRVYFGATTERAGTTLVSDPVEIFAGYFAGRSCSFSGGAEAFLHDMILQLGIGPAARARASITHGYEDQIAAYPGDTAGRQVQNALKRARNPSVWPAA